MITLTLRAGLLAGLIALSATPALPDQRVEVPITLRVLPYAEFSAPPDSSFLLRVEPLACPAIPSWVSRTLRSLWNLSCWTVPGLDAWPPIKPVRIPFSVEGNATVSVSMRPDGFLRAAFGRYLGKAVRSGGATLGYHAVAHFPAPSLTYRWVSEWPGWDEWGRWLRWTGFGSLPAWSQLAHLPGLDGAGSPPLTADLTAQANQAFGVVYVVARRSWTTTGSWAAPGDYYGNITITVTAE
jgi:hypothetical protein